MLGAVISLIVVLAAAYALTQIGGVITLLFVAAVLFLAYRRLSLLTFTATSRHCSPPTPGSVRAVRQPDCGRASCGCCSRGCGC